MLQTIIPCSTSLAFPARRVHLQQKASCLDVLVWAACLAWVSSHSPEHLRCSRVVFPFILSSPSSFFFHSEQAKRCQQHCCNKGLNSHNLKLHIDFCGKITNSYSLLSISAQGLLKTVFKHSIWASISRWNLSVQYYVKMMKLKLPFFFFFLRCNI